MSKVEKEILSLLKDSPDGMQVDEIAKKLNLVRHTVSKYLQILKAKKLVMHRTVGRTKLWKEASAGVKIRPLSLDNIKDIVRIEKRIEGKLGIINEERMEYLKEATRYNIERSDPMMSLGAELDENIVGFIIGEIRIWEFGIGEKTGWIRILGVDPDFQRRGIGRKLGEALLEHFERRGIKRVRTMAEWYTGDLISFFRSLGFNMLNMIPLEKELNT
ncbi:MAG: GNAT family N-acetyltransferase [Candidatus Aminicenantes bacterium]|nr:MAG: GNAT family N-acetyltransferase [Candidatus Aminicenantes bacterium]